MTIDITTDTTSTIYLQEPGQGRHLHVLDNLATLKTIAGSNQSMAVIEFTAPKNFGPPLHSHGTEDEFMYVLEGELDVQIDGNWQRVTPGGFAWLPRGVPHTFQVMTETARMLSATAGAGEAGATFDSMMAELGEDVEVATVPAPMDIDPGQVALVCGKHGVDVLGPPPAPRA